jgi:hypothetical protein
VTPKAATLPSAQIQSLNRGDFFGMEKITIREIQGIAIARIGRIEFSVISVAS